MRLLRAGQRSAPLNCGVRRQFERSSMDHDLDKIVLADAGYCSEANAKYLSDEHIDGDLADPMFRKRDPRFAPANHHKPTSLDEPFAKPKRALRFQPRTSPLPGPQPRDLPGRQAALSQRSAPTSERL
jgi:hypothetical protein